MPDKHDIQLSVRVPRRTALRVADLAAHHGRTKSEEFRLALELHDARATLAYLKTSQVSEDLGADVAQREQDRVEAALQRLEDTTYGPRPGLPLVNHSSAEVVTG
jgi:hypothetical protein